MTEEPEEPNSDPASRDNKEKVAESEPPQPEPSTNSRFPIVGIGASAGGIEAFKQMLRALPDDTGMSFVLILHLDPTHISILAEILSGETRMPVSQVKGEVITEPNHVYVIPPGMSMIIEGGALQLLARTEPRGQHRPIDQFFRSLAEDQGHTCIGVILSGSATDGSLGLEEIKAAGGITFAQDQTAQHDSMPRSAIAAGCVDFVLPPDGIAEEIARIARHPLVSPMRPGKAEKAGAEANIGRVLSILRHTTGVDFTNYKFNTLYRRITRRMVLNKMESLRDYAHFLQQDPAEAEALYEDVLISVTSFFRNPEAFQTLKEKVLPKLTNDRSRHDPLRVWVLGCSTGEEAYSLAMILAEFSQESGKHFGVQIFATDLAGNSIERARTGVYTKDIVQDVSVDRLRRFFVEVDGTHRVSKQIRDMCVFARHNVLSDPPFSRIDLISCRNLLIYLEPVLQQRIIPVFHYALKANGFLWLGASETIGSYRDYFDVEDSKYKIYAKKPGSPRAPVVFPTGTYVAEAHGDTSKPHDYRERNITGTDVQKEADRILLARYSPPGVLVNGDLDILQFRGETGAYLAPAPGRASLNLLKMAREGLLVALRGAIHRAKREETMVREEGLRVKTNGDYRDINIEVVPVRGSGGKEINFLVLFDDPEAAARAWPKLRALEPAIEPGAETQGGAEANERQMTRLTQELAATREYLQSVIEQQEAANEELQSANEEVQSANEELQSINEELETSKEEIQSANEELATVNDELNNRNLELSQTNNDQLNLISGVQMAIVMLGQDLRIRRFTPTAEKLLNLIPTDVGRPITDIKLNIDITDLEMLLIESIDTVSIKEREVRDRHGRWHALRVRPYKTLDNRIDGAVIVLIDIDDLKKNQEVLRQQAGLLDQTHDAIFVWEIGGGIIYWNRGAEKMYGFTKEQASGRIPAELLTTTIGSEKIWSLEERLEATGEWAGELTQRTRDGRQIIVESRSVVLTEPDGRRVVLETNTDISERKRLEDALRQRINDLGAADQQKNEFLVMLAHELRNPLAPVRNAAEILRMMEVDADTAAKARGVIDRQIDHMARMIDDLLDVSRITQGKVELRLEVVDVSAVMAEAVGISKPYFDARQQRLSLRTPKEPVYVQADPTRLEQIFSNLLNNASKFSDHGGKIFISVDVTGSNSNQRRQTGTARASAHSENGDEVVIAVRDDGMGISKEMLPHVFDLFAQADRSLDRSQGGLGIGLTMVRRLIELHGGKVEALSDGPRRGSEFIIRLPLHDGEPEETQPEPANAPKAEPGKCRILVVDDNLDGAESLAMLLRLAGHDVHIAFDGPNAVDIAAKVRPEVVLLDIGLPTMNGYEVVRQLRQRLRLKDTFIVALTGYGRDEDRQRAEEVGFDEYLTKPIDHDDLRELLARRFPSDSKGKK